MPQSLPDLNLTLGQVLWALGEGRDPDKLLRDQVRYLRQLGIPRKSADAAAGSGNRIRYDFHDLVELGLALTGLKLRFRPKDIKAGIDADRERLHDAVELAWRELPEEVLEERWPKSRGTTKPILADDLYLRLHDRRSEQWGKLDMVGFDDDLTTGRQPFDAIERMPDGQILDVISLKRSIVPWVAWALEAPGIRTGPK